MPGTNLVKEHVARPDTPKIRKKAGRVKVVASKHWKELGDCLDLLLYS